MFDNEILKLKKQVEELEVPEEPKTRSLLAPDVTSEEVL